MLSWLSVFPSAARAEFFTGLIWTCTASSTGQYLKNIAPAVRVIWQINSFIIVLLENPILEGSFLEMDNVFIMTQVGIYRKIKLKRSALGSGYNSLYIPSLVIMQIQLIPWSTVQWRSVQSTVAQLSVMTVSVCTNDQTANGSTWSLLLHCTVLQCTAR